MRLGRTIFGIWLCIGLASGIGFAAEVRNIHIENQGSGDIDQQSVLVHISLKKGDTYSRAAVSRDVRALQQTGRFSYVGAEFDTVPGGIDVTFILVNKLRLTGPPKINGNKEVGESRILEWVGYDAGAMDLVDENVLALGVRKVKEEYAKRYYQGTRVDWTIEEDKKNGTASVTINIDEGVRGKVRSIQFLGNENVKNWSLRKVMEQKRVNPLSFITKAGVYNPAELDNDLRTIGMLYKSKGFLDVKVKEPIVEMTQGKRIKIKVPIEEGQVYRINDIKIVGVSTFPLEDVMRSLVIRPGQVASQLDIDVSAKRIENYYGSRGYIQTRVSKDLTADLQAAIVDVTFEVDEGSLNFIRDISIRGNSRTQDKVIRRELVVFPGDIYDEVKVDRSVRKLRNLNYFSTVSADQENTGEANKKDLVIRVDEKKTGQFILGFGFSSIDDLIGFVEVSQGNFDIRGWPFTGGGQKMKLRAQLGTERRDVELSFVEPWFLDRKLSLQLDAFQHDRRFLSDDYDQRNTGGRIGLGRALWGRNRAKLTYGLENVEVVDVDDNASDLIKAEEGERIKSSLTLTLTHDTRDNFFIPSKGNRTLLIGEYAGGPLAGETDIYGLELRTSQYWPLWFDHILSFRGAVNMVEEYGDSDSVPIFDRKFTGGSRTLRGFRFRDVGPKDENGEPIGGKSSWFGSLEYTVPLFEKFRVATFYDLGMVHEDVELDFGDYNSDFGFGVRFDFPGLPLRIDYAWPLEADEFNDKSSARFNILLGHVF